MTSASPPCRRNDVDVLCSQLFLCLSQACLGKRSGFSVKMASQKRTFSAPDNRHARRHADNHQPVLAAQHRLPEPIERALGVVLQQRLRRCPAAAAAAAAAANAIQRCRCARRRQQRRARSVEGSRLLRCARTSTRLRPPAAQHGLQKKAACCSHFSHACVPSLSWQKTTVYSI